jgi:hypothetical protein
MKVKTFTGSETAKVDKRVNDWLAQFGIRPHHTNTAIGQFTVKAEDQRHFLVAQRHGLGVLHHAKALPGKGSLDAPLAGTAPTSADAPHRPLTNSLNPRRISYDARRPHS